MTPAAANAAILPSCTPPTSENPCEPEAGANPNARTRNDAICARLTTSSGQNSNGSDLQPFVTPNSANRSTYPARHPPASTSPKRDDTPDAPSPNTLTIHTAISPRNNGSNGQNNPSPHSVPSNTPSAANNPTLAACTPPPTSENPDPCPTAEPTPNPTAPTNNTTTTTQTRRNTPKQPPRKTTPRRQPDPPRAHRPRAALDAHAIDPPVCHLNAALPTERKLPDRRGDPLHLRARATNGRLAWASHRDEPATSAPAQPAGLTPRS